MMNFFSLNSVDNTCELCSNVKRAKNLFHAMSGQYQNIKETLKVTCAGEAITFLKV